MAYALGKEGSTRKKLANASNAILQFVGPMAFIAGDVKERQRCRDYLGWLLEQKDGKVNVDMRNRTDITELDIDEDSVRWILSSDGLPELRKIEQESSTFCCMADSDTGGRILICGFEEGGPHSDTGRLKAERLISRLLSQPRNSWGGRGGGGGGKGWRQRSRSPRRYVGGKAASRGESWSQRGKGGGGGS